jgi:hypothetical protein
MAQTGEQIIAAIAQDVACPGCGYNLRGLSGDVVSCPECGKSCDVADLIRRRWIGSWRRAPGMQTLAWPALWVLMLPLSGVYVAAPLREVLPAEATPAVFAADCLTILVVWLWLMGRVLRSWGRAGLVLAVLAHLVVAAYVAGAFCGVIFLAAVLMESHRLGNRAASPADLWVIAAPVACALLWWGGFVGYRYLANRCIRRYLRGGM